MEAYADGVVVLHVDDDPQFLDLTKEFLEARDADVTVLTETDPETALRRLDEDDVDCVVSDYQMPRMDGVDLLKAVRERYPNLPFVLFTGKGSEAVASEASTAGVTTYLQKGGTDTLDLLADEVESAVDHRRSQRWAQVAKDRLVGLFDEVDGFYFLEEDWTITYWNGRIADRTGRPPEEALGESYWDVFPEARELETEERFRTAMETGEPVRFEVWYEAGEYWADVRVSPVEEGLFVHSRDVTEQTEHERELRRRNRILESFANTVSHDLRNPLSVAEGRLELARESGDFDHLEAVTKAHTRMENLIDELLRIARDEDVSFSEVSLRERAEAAWSTVPGDDMELVVEGDCRFEAHASQLRRLFENLLWNAVEHGEADVVRVGPLDDGFYVEDDGVGVPPAERDSVFEAGYSTSDDGTGYGLRIVRTIAEMHDWTVSVVGGRDGGARFEVEGVRSA